MTINPADLLPLATQAVSIAGRIVKTKLPGTVTAKGDRDMATEVDYAAEQAVREFLSRETPEIAFLGEEEGVTGRGGSGLMWALDPLDGTANFLHGIPLCGVSLGLLQDDEPVLGVVELPFHSTRYAAATGHGATVDGQPIRCGEASALDQAIVSIGDYAVGDGAQPKNRSRLALTGLLASRVQRMRMFGSAAIDLVWVAEGRTDACVMLSNKPWDTAAGVLIAREAGAATVDSDGTPHTMAARATIAASPKILNELMALIDEAARHSNIGGGLSN
ncbi:myo-inositol-1(or 4)-monophosphatase [Sinosporangium album]|uniref:Inositol-1-monophosphatase n=1 Tax=Sinosporangium album TaxID=504805 RepID=A0A1G8JTR4_9ACTN|nr:inositol monophosphatase family protein [Sinosporangium album]SDI34515.1 myo-inositol-1(or 4)-monophosphatase [Sinosporangium album]